ncbi:MAG: FHA domain-containing protein [Planctomycetota bacterium]
MSIHPNVNEYLEKRSHMDREAFVNRFRTSFLVIEFGVESYSADAFRTMSAEGNGDRPTEPAERKPVNTHIALAVPVVKSERNSFLRMITLGRATNNDVVVPHPSVSKLHVYFRVDNDSGSVFVTDSGSTYGTTLDRLRLERNETYPMKSGSVLLLADSVRVTFLVSADFYDFLGTLPKPSAKA